MEINKLIDALRHCSVKGNSCRACPNYNQDSGCLDRLHAESASVIEAMQAHIDALESERQAWLHDQERNRWIPVTERLPEDDGLLTFYDDGRMRRTTVLAYTVFRRIIPKNRLKVRAVGNDYLDTQATDGWVWASGSEDVTHWMPMPKRPKEGE